MFLDTTILIEILRGSRKVIDYVEHAAKNEALLFSIVQIGELSDWSYSNNLDPSKVLNEIKNMATAVSVSETICLEGSRIKQERKKSGKSKFGLIDGIIAASAMSFDQKLLTKDRDFEGLENVAII